ncbi:P-loop containing nucleoside triphosphate hydrolase protein [Phakopsora pachyrhizi]|uniref:DNA helicase n=1 Tax=Phakopsora pachyrhizi TaxID=170000 RepID=A0AAV0AMY3_PHAPC|nr:P-loop containing nucleoside triphosphate hydrolase protein [Phakopsora pachyrhizi]
MTSPKELGAWFDGHLRLLRIERESEKVEFDLLTSEKVRMGQTRLLERMGISIGSLGVRQINIGSGGKTVIELERPAQFHTDPKLPYHSFRPGVPAGIIDHDLGSSKSTAKSSEKKDLKVIEGVISRVSDTSLSIIMASKDDQSQLEIPTRCRIVKLADTATFDRLESTMKSLRESCESTGLCVESSKNDRGLTQPSKNHLCHTGVKDIVVPDCATHLNDSQKRALQHALSSLPVTLIFGPPGTGKTHTLASIIAALFHRGDRILVVAASNLAIDNIAERLLGLGLPLTRLGHPARILETLSRSTLEHQVNTSEDSEIIDDLKREINENLKKLTSQGKERLRGKARSEVYKDVQELRKDFRHRDRGRTLNILKKARIVCATTHGAGSRQLENERFDVAIVDACWIPILKCQKKLILAGDPLQLPPTVKSLNRSSTTKKISNLDLEVKTNSPKTGSTSQKRALKMMKPPRTLEKTMFDRLLGNYPEMCCLLEVQYRMNESIMRFPCQELYDSKLRAADSVAKHLLKNLPHIKNHDEDGISDPVLFLDTAGSYMFDRKAENSEGGLLNENEADLVVKRVVELVNCGLKSEEIMVISPYAAQVSLLDSLLKPKFPTLSIGSIDSCQGRESEAVIISLCRSNSEGVIGFLSENRRLNVAMTRAKRHLTVIGDSDTLSKGGDFLKHWMDWLENNAEVRVVGM